MNKKEIFKAAHKLAKTFEGNYSACFSMALKEIYSTASLPVITNIKEWSNYGKKRVYFEISNARFYFDVINAEFTVNEKCTTQGIKNRFELITDSVMNYFSTTFAA